jgi:glycosyltransferase involved in cell wall biosynthesis
MNSHLKITPLILTYNEAPNLRRTLAGLAWAKDVVILDSFSTDETLVIANSFPQVRVVQRKFDSFADQCNFGLEQIRTEWVLSLDADYVLTPALVAEIGRLEAESPAAGYQARFRYCIHGRPLRGSLYPPRTVLYRQAKARYHNEGHGHRVHIEGPVRPLAGWIEHDDRKPLDRWFGEQLKYASQEARHLLAADPARLKTADRIRKRILLAPGLVLLYTLLAKGLLLDGWPGWFYVGQRTFAELLLSICLLDEKLKREIEDRRPGPG